MSNLLPQSIYAAYEQGQLAGRREAVALFVDVSGFTSLTEQLMAAGVEGAEELSLLLNEVFAPLLQEVYRQEGEVVRFFGDAFLALFWVGEDGEKSDGEEVLPVLLRALHTAVRLRAHILRQPVRGALRLEVKQGVGYGTAVWGITGPPEHRLFYVHGSAISQATHGERLAQPGEILLHQALARQLPPHLRQLAPKPQSDYWQLSYLPGGSNRLVSVATPLATPQDPTILHHFFPNPHTFLERQGEFRNITAIFLSFAPNLDRATLDSFATTLIQTADQYGGFLSELSFGDKTDLFLLYFGAPISFENNSTRALSFLLDLQLRAPTPPWRAGVAAGPVYAGLLGSAWRMEYKMLGATVNLAARLMTQAEWGQVLTDTAVSQTPGFRFVPQGDIQYKGFATPQPTYALHGIKSHRTLRHNHPLVGREAELGQLRAKAQAAFSLHQATAVLLLGEPGIGKSRLAHALQEHLSSTHTAVCWFHAPADPILRQTLNPFRYALARYFRQEQDLPISLNERRFQAVWSRLYRRLRQQGGLTVHRQQQLNRARLYLENFLDLPLSQELPSQATARTRYLSLLNAISALFSAEAALQPVVLLLDDYHWVDSASPELLALLQSQLAEAPFLLLVSSRHDAEGQPPTLPFATSDIQLAPLPDTAVSAQIQTLLQGQPDARLAALLQEKGQANPLFIQQLLLHLRDQRLIQEEDGVWRLTAPDTAVPTTLSTILMARLDNLPLPVQQLVKTAAVIGREFQLRLLQHLHPNQTEMLAQQAEQAQIWARLDRQRYRFRHALLRDVVYEMQSVAQRKAVHGRVAQAYETLLTPDELPPYYAELAYHYGIAQNLPAERQYARLAGQQAAEAYAYEEALHWLNRALALTPSSDFAAQYELLAVRERLFDLQGLRDAQAQDLVQLMALALPLGTAEQLEVTLRFADYYEITGDYSQAMLAAQRGIQTAQMAQASLEEGRGRLLHGRVLWRQGHLPQAWAEFTRAQQLALANNALSDQSIVLRMMGLVCVDTDRLDEAQTYFVRALALARQAGDQINEGYALNNSGIIYYRRRNFSRALDYFQKAYNLAEEIGDRQGLVLYRGNVAVTHMNLGDFAQAAQLQQAKIALAQQTNVRNELAASLATMSYIWHVLGDQQAALRSANEALQLAQTLQMPENEAYALTYRGRVQLYLGNFAQAQQDLQKAYSLRQQMGMGQRALEPLALLVECFLRQEEIATAVSLTEELLVWVFPWRLHATHDPFRVPLACYQVLLAVGDPRAPEVLATAYTHLCQEVDSINDTAVRQRFLAIPTHATLCQLHTSQTMNAEG
jgi:predicted ATPase/class 3 adenylate cyclase